MTKGEDTRRSILDRAVQLARKVGLEGLSIGRLAEELSLSKSGLFAHFGSKDALRTTLRDVLTDYGYVVHTAPDGATALALLEAHVDEISILITDVVMPKMGGRDLANAVLTRRPGLPVLFISGYAPDEQLRRSAEDRTVAFLQKPFLPEQLARAVRELLATS